MLIKSFKLFEAEEEVLFHEIPTDEYDNILVKYSFPQLPTEDINNIISILKSDKRISFTMPLRGVFEINKRSNISEQYKIYIKKNEDEYYYVKIYKNGELRYKTTHYICDTRQGLDQFIKFIIYNL